MTPPCGTGIWISFNSSQTTSVSNDTIVARAVDCGLGWLAVKWGEDGRSTRWLLRGADLITRAHAAGLLIYGWNYSRPDTWPQQVASMVQVQASGVDGFIIDAETEWEFAPGAHGFSNVDRHPAAASFVQALRAAMPDAFLAHAPIWRPQSHPRFPYQEFGKLDAAMPQAYWCAAGQSAEVFCQRVDAAWRQYLADYPGSTANVWPIGLTYGRGDGWDQFPGRLTAEDIHELLTRYSSVPRSFFSWDAATTLFWGALRAASPPPSLTPAA